MREMTDMDIREAVKNKEKYGEIAEYFKAKNFFSVEDLVLLIDAIEQMSPQRNKGGARTGRGGHECSS